MEAENKKSLNLPQVDLDTARTAHDSFKDAFYSENARHSNLIVKTQTLATVAAILFASLSLSGFTVWPSKAPAILSFAFGIWSIWYSLTILIARDFTEIKLSKVLEDSELMDKPQFVLIRLARSYDEAIVACRPIIDDLYLKFDGAVKTLRWSAILALLAFALQSILGGNVNEENNSNQGTSAAPAAVEPAPTPAPETQPTLSAVTAPYGVQTVKKSIDGAKIKTRDAATESRENKNSENKE